MVPPSKNLLPDQDLPMNDGSPPPIKRVHVVKPGAEPVADIGHEAPVSTPRPGPLQIDYSTTRVVPGALARLQRTPGVVRADRSELAETFKMLRSQLFQRLRADGHSLLAVTSPRHIEGKSLTAVNLALAIAAEMDSAVLLIDADLSGRGLQTLFGLEGLPGLGEHLAQGTPIPELLVNPGVERFVLLPAGGGGTLHSAELLGTRAAQHLIREMKQRYSDRYVIVDLPPLLETADALAFLPQADTTLMVVEEHTTSITDMEQANELMAPFNLVGAVVTKARDKPGRGQRPGLWQRLFKGKAGA
jgi:Mrp family chromosome partitioning ATPase